MGTYDTRGGAAISPPDEEHGSAEIELTRAEWQIICGAVSLLTSDARGSDTERVKALSVKLERYKFASSAIIEVWE